MSYKYQHHRLEPSFSRILPSRKPSDDLQSLMDEIVRLDKEAHKSTMALQKMLKTLPESKPMRRTARTQLPGENLLPKNTYESSQRLVNGEGGGKQLHLSKEAVNVLKNAQIDGNTVRLKAKLDRKLYEDVNAALEALGGKWDRKVQGHVFTEAPAAKIKAAIQSGEVTPPSKNGYFPTPEPIVKKLLTLAKLQPGMTVLEPSAGQGAIADELRGAKAKVTAVENLPDNAKVLKRKGYNVAEMDFLKYKGPARFDRVVMNPPFEKQADVDHVLHAYEVAEARRPAGVCDVCRSNVSPTIRKPLLLGSWSGPTAEDLTVAG